VHPQAAQSTSLPRSHIIGEAESTHSPPPTGVHPIWSAQSPGMNASHGRASPRHPAVQSSSRQQLAPTTHAPAQHKPREQAVRSGTGSCRHAAATHRSAVHWFPSSQSSSAQHARQTPPQQAGVGAEQCSSVQQPVHAPPQQTRPAPQGEPSVKTIDAHSPASHRFDVHALPSSHSALVVQRRRHRSLHDPALGGSQLSPAPGSTNPSPHSETPHVPPRQIRRGSSPHPVPSAAGVPAAQAPVPGSHRSSPLHGSPSRHSSSDRQPETS
jgi:hypothetical protein